MAERRREIQPPELAALVDLSERPRAGNWSLRAALTRYAQPQPMRVSRLLDEVRRLEAALGSHLAELRQDGPDVWDAVVVAGDDPPMGEPGGLVGLLVAAAEIDRVGNVLASWAVDRQGERPDAAVDAVTADVAARLDALGVEREQQRPPAARRRG